MTQYSDALVLFGASGDLAWRMIFPAAYELSRAGVLQGPIIGVARSDWSDDDLRQRARSGIAAAHGDAAAEDQVTDRLTASMRYVSGDYREASTYQALREALGNASAPLTYLAIPPSLFEDVIAGLGDVGLNEEGRIVVEKPFGRDLDSARELNECVLRTFPEESVFRIDHYLGKEATLDLLVFRLANAFLEPIWSRHYIDSVQITLAEDFGMFGRGGFYDNVGALRDVVQNHVLQTLSFVAMEPPVAADAQALRDEKAKVLRGMRPLDPDEVVHGQYKGYRDEDGVAEDSQTETFVALRAWIDSWRWSGVPFFIRAGKNLAATATEVLVEFRQPPQLFFAEADGPPPHPNHLSFRMKPGVRMALSTQIKRAGDEIVSRPVELSYEYDERGDGPYRSAYARLIGDALEGDQTLFARHDSIEQAWRVVEPALDQAVPTVGYEPGGWGPAEADALIEAHGGWHFPGYSG